MNTFSLPILHARGAYPTGWLHSNWHLEPTVIIGAVVLAALYIVWTGSKNRDAAGELVNPVTSGQRTLFMSGLVVLVIALNPPLDDLSDYYLLTAHMVQHMLLMFAVVPLLLLGTPDWLLTKVLSPRPLRAVWVAITQPIPAALISTAIFVVWHFPFAYDAAIRHQPIHVAEHNLFLLAAAISWWPVLGPMLPGQTRLSPLLQCLYLFALSLPSGILGAFITLSNPDTYASYVGVPEIWGIDRTMDHELAGLLMWVGGGMIYLLVITIVFFSWSAREQAKDDVPAARRAAPAQGATRP
jgi:putative membrane protein